MNSVNPLAAGYRQAVRDKVRDGQEHLKSSMTFYTESVKEIE